MPGEGIARCPAPVWQRHHGHRATTIYLGQNGASNLSPAGNQQIHDFTTRDIQRSQRIKGGIMLGADDAGDVTE